MKLENCHGCKWFYIRTIKGYTEYMCSYVRNHQTGMKWGRLINIKRKKTCNRKESTIVSAYSELIVRTQ